MSAPTSRWTARSPVPYSMLSFGSAAFMADKTLVSDVFGKPGTSPGASGHPDTMAWWAKHPEAWKACRQDLRAPAGAMADYVKWLDALPAKPVFVGYPAAFDFMFVYWYLMRFAGRSPFSFSALDIKTMAMVMLDKEYQTITKRTMPKRWFDAHPHSQSGRDDAIEQGMLFCNIAR